MGVKIYEDETKGRVIFDTGRRRRSAPLGGVVQASAYVRGGVTSTSRVTIVRSDKFKRDGVTPRRIFRRLRISSIENEGGTRLVSGLGYNMTQVIDYINSLGTSAPNEIEFKRDGSTQGKGNVLDFVGFDGATRSGKTLTITAPSGVGTETSINTTGIITATSFTGSGANITGISTLNIVDYGVGLGGGGGAGNPVTSGIVTGIGNTTLRLTLNDASFVDVDMRNLMGVAGVSSSRMFYHNTGAAATSIHNWSNGPLFYGEKLKKGDELILTPGTHHWQVGLWAGNTTESSNLTSPSKWTTKWYFKPNHQISNDSNSSYGTVGIGLNRTIDIQGSALIHSLRWDYATNKLELWEIDGPHSWHIDSATVAMGVTESYIHFTSYTDGYEPGNGSQKRTSEYTKISQTATGYVADSLHIRDGFKNNDVWKNNNGFGPGMKLKFTIPASHQNVYYSNNYLGSGTLESGESGAYQNGDMTWRISQFEKIHKFERCGMNTSYTSLFDDITETVPIAGRNCSWRYHLDNSWDIFDEDTDEVILTGDSNYDGNPINPYVFPTAGSTNMNQLVFDWEPEYNGAQWYCEHRDWSVGSTRYSWPAGNDKVKPFTRFADSGETGLNGSVWAVTWGEKMRPGQEFQFTVPALTSNLSGSQNFCIGYLASDYITLTGLKFYRDGTLKPQSEQTSGVTLNAGANLSTDYSGTDFRIQYEYGTNKLKYFTLVNSVRTLIATADVTLDGNPIFVSLGGDRSYVPTATGVQVYGWEFAHHKNEKNNRGEPWYNPWNQWRVNGFPRSIVGLSTGKHALATTVRIERDSVLRHKDGLPKGYQMKWQTALDVVGNTRVGVWKTSNPATSDDIDSQAFAQWDWSFQTGGDEDIDGPDMNGMTINTSNSNYVGGSDLEWENPNPGVVIIGFRYHNDNTVDLYDFTGQEVIATVDGVQDGNPIHISLAFNNEVGPSRFQDNFFGGGDVSIATTTN